MADPFFAALRADGWRVPAKKRIAYRGFHGKVLPGGGVAVKIRAIGASAEWQIGVHPRVLGRRGWRFVTLPYERAETLEDALRDAVAEARRVADGFRAGVAHVPLWERRFAHVPPSTTCPPAPATTPPPDGPERNAYRMGKRTATVVLDPGLHARLMAAALDRGTTLQALLAEGAELVLARPGRRRG